MCNARREDAASVYGYTGTRLQKDAEAECEDQHERGGQLPPVLLKPAHVEVLPLVVPQLEIESKF